MWCSWRWLWRLNNIATNKDSPQHPRKRVLLVSPPNSYRIAAYIKAATNLQIDAVVASPGEHSLVSAVASGLHIDLNDPAALDVLIAASAKQPFQGVIATDDAAVELASRVAQQLSLPHNPPSAAVLSRRKDLARACLREAGIAVPEHCIINLDTALQPQLASIKYPVVIKPVSLSASRGVIRVNDEQACLQAIERIKRILTTEEQLPTEETNKLLIETFIPGHEIALEGLLRNGDLELLAMFDKPDPMQGPYFEETYYITPSSHNAEIQQAALQTVQAACRAFGLVEGPVHAELRISDEGVWIIEVASRTIGGECARMLTYGTGYDLETLVIKKALGEQVNIAAQDKALGVLMLPIPGGGVLRRVEGIQTAQKVPGVEEILISVREGYELVPLPEGGSYLGFVFARGSSPAVVEAALRQAYGELDIVVAPVFKMADQRV